METLELFKSAVIAYDLSLDGLQPISRNKCYNDVMYNCWFDEEKELIRDLLFSSPT